jgi:hypothetical protein
MYHTLEYLTQHAKTTYQQTITHISNRAISPDVLLEPYQIRHFTHIFTHALTKLSSTPSLNHTVKDLLSVTQHPLKSMIDFIKHYKTPFKTTACLQQSNIQQLAWDFFMNFQQEAICCRHFAFGTPSQKQH